MNLIKSFLLGNTARFLVIAASISVLALSGCSGEKKSAPVKAAKEKPAATAGADSGGGMPANHAPVDKTAESIAKMSHGNIRTQKEVNISDEVKNAWKEVTLKITNNSSGESQTLPLEIGSTVTLNPGIRLHIEAFVPDYAISENKIESRSNEPNNSAVLVDLIEGENVVARGWIFRDFPEFNSYTDQRYGLVLVAPEAPAKK